MYFDIGQRKIGLQGNNNRIWAICKESCEKGIDTGRKMAVSLKKKKTCHMK